MESCSPRPLPSHSPLPVSHPFTLAQHDSHLPQTPAAPVLKRQKRKEPEVDYTHSTLGQEPQPPTKRGKKGANNGEASKAKSKNTAVYVTGLPSDTDMDEIVSRFSKCGLIEEDETGEPKVKMYARDDGSFSGDALVVYFKEESVMLAINILEDAELRIGEANTRMGVRQAEFGHKNEGDGSGEGVSGSGSGGAPPKPRKTVDKKKATRRIVKMQKCVLF